MAIHPGGKCAPLDEYIAERFGEYTVESMGGFRFSPGFLFRMRKKLSKPHNTSIIYVNPPFNYFKRLFIFLLFIFIPSREKIALVDERQKAVKIKWSDGFLLSLLFIPVIMLSIFVQAGAFIYVAFVGIFLKTGGKLRKPDLKNLKVAFLGPSLQLLDSFRGSTSHVRGVIGGFKKLGWEPVIFAPGKFEGVEGKYHIIPPVFRNVLTGGVVDMLFDFIFTFKSLPLIRKENPAFLYQRHGRYSICGIMLSRLTGIPLILEMNALLARESGRWSRTGNYLRRYIAMYEKLCVRHAHRISAISTILRDDIIAAGVEPKRVFVNPNGADENAFKPGCGGDEIRKKLRLEENIVIGFSGSFYPWHGVDVLTEIIEKTIPVHKNVTFLLVGEGPERPVLEEKLEGKIPMLHLNFSSILEQEVDERSSAGAIPNPHKNISKFNGVIFTGRISPGDVPAYLDTCDILLSPIGEGKEYSSPIKIFEYMAVGKVILCFDMGQMSNILKNGIDSVMTSPGDVDSYFNALEKLISDRNLRDSLGSAARKKFLEHYTWKANVKRVIDGIAEIEGG